MMGAAASQVAAFLGAPLHGEDLPVTHPADLADAAPGSLVWLKRPDPDKLALLERTRPSLIICTAEAAAQLGRPCLVSQRPRLDFIRAVTHFFKPQRVPGIHATALIEPGAVIGSGARIGAYTRIGPQVVIGADCDIGSGVAIEGPVRIGDRCVIKSNSVLGDQGFGFAYDEEGKLLHFPHLGRLILEDDVWIGACTHVGLGTLGATHIGKGTKVDDLVQFGHNCKAGPHTLIMAHAVLCGGAEVGASCWISPSSVIKEKVRIADRVVVGLGAVVLRDVAEGLVVAGVPARPIDCRHRPNE